MPWIQIYEKKERKQFCLRPSKINGDTTHVFGKTNVSEAGLGSAHDQGDLGHVACVVRDRDRDRDRVSL